MPSAFRPMRTWSETSRNCWLSGGTPEPQAGGLVQRFSVPSGKLEHGTSSGSEGRVPLRGTISPRWIHRDQPGDGQPGGSAVLQQAGNGGTVDQGGQTSVKMTRLSSHRFRSNEVRLWLS